MENGSVLGGLLIPLRASWGESLSMRALPLILHKARRSKVCNGIWQMVIKSCVLFLLQPFTFLQDLCAFIAAIYNGYCVDQEDAMVFLVYHKTLCILT